MSKLPYLIAEVNAALEVYVSGRTGQQYNRTAFVLCVSVRPWPSRHPPKTHTFSLCGHEWVVSTWRDNGHLQSSRYRDSFREPME